MLIYCFSIHSVDGNDRETTGRMVLADDDAARAFGKALIRGILRRDTPDYSDWTMDVAKGTRLVCSIPFTRTEFRPDGCLPLSQNAPPERPVGCSRVL